MILSQQRYEFYYWTRSVPVTDFKGLPENYNYGLAVIYAERFDPMELSETVETKKIHIDGRLESSIMIRLK